MTSKRDKKTPPPALSIRRNLPSDKTSSGIASPMADIHAAIDVRDIDVDRIERDPSQPRKHFNEISLQGLAQSIKEKGVLQPIGVTPTGEGGKYTLHFGERRWRAAQLAGLKKIPARVFDAVKDKKEIRLIENIHREALLPEEEARAVIEAIEEKGISQTDFGISIGKDKTYVSRCVKIAGFLVKEGVSEAVQGIRTSHDPDSRITFEVFYDAACKPTPQEGVEFIKSVVANKLTRETIRSLKQKGPAEWTEAKFLKHLKGVRSKTDFSFADKILLGQNSETVLKEIDDTILSFDKAAGDLRKIKEKLGNE